ncbi:MAG: glucodextranase DOMON-like domain-containing protein [Acidobacteriota bacterium]
MKRFGVGGGSPRRGLLGNENVGLRPLGWWALFAALALIAVATLPVLTQGEEKEGDRKGEIFAVADPYGDDFGAGELVYPLREGWGRGDLDLLRFSASRVDGGTRFEARLARSIRAPMRRAVDFTGIQETDIARLPFYTFNLDAYIDTSGSEGEEALEGWGGERAMMPGRLAELPPGAGWEKAVILTPAPAQARGELVRTVAAALEDDPGTSFSHWLQSPGQSPGQAPSPLPTGRQLRRAVEEALSQRVHFPQQVHVRGREITFFVPDSFLGGAARAEWGYVVVITGAELQQRVKIPLLAPYTRPESAGLAMPVVSGRSKDAFGGGAWDQPLQPWLIDILEGPGADQGAILRSFDPTAGTLARVPPVVPAILPAADPED